MTKKSSKFATSLEAENSFGAQLTIIWQESYAAEGLINYCSCAQKNFLHQMLNITVRMFLYSKTHVVFLALLNAAV